MVVSWRAGTADLKPTTAYRTDRIHRGTIQLYDSEADRVLAAERCDHQHKHQDTALKCAKSMLRQKEQSSG